MRLKMVSILSSGVSSMLVLEIRNSQDLISIGLYFASSDVG